jgi:hypothetical protein
MQRRRKSVRGGLSFLRSPGSTPNDHLGVHARHSGRQLSPRPGRRLMREGFVLGLERFGIQISLFKDSVLTVVNIQL